jgi:all-trans-retinol 13,14-reductase
MVLLHFIFINSLLTYIGCEHHFSQLKWSKIDRSYDIVYNGTTSERIEMTEDHDENRKVLSEHFGITSVQWKSFHRAKFYAKFWSYVVLQLKLWHPLILRVMWPFVAWPYRRYALRSTTDVLRDCGFSSEAAGALTYHYGDHGTPPASSPFFMTALLDTHYKGGAFFPKGGSRSIAATLIAAIERRGGYVFASSPVEKILTHRNMFEQPSAYGVRVKGVDVLTRQFVVSDAGIIKTFGMDSDQDSIDQALVNAEHGAVQRALLHKNKDEKHDAVSACISDLCLFIGLDRSDKDLGLIAQNIWHVHDWNHDEAWQKMSNDTSAGKFTAS